MSWGPMVVTHPGEFNKDHLAPGSLKNDKIEKMQFRTTSTMPFHMRCQEMSRLHNGHLMTQAIATELCALWQNLAFCEFSQTFIQFCELL